MLARLVGCVAGVLVCTIVQELVHTEQVRRLGGEMRFACAYCRGYLAGGGYRTNPLEEEAGCVRRRMRTLTRWSLIGIQWSTVNMRLAFFDGSLHRGLGYVTSAAQSTSCGFLSARLLLFSREGVQWTRN